MAGILYLVSTPIGNLEDITLRALRVLKEEVDLIAAEDTRVSKRLLNHYEINKPLISYFEHNKHLREGYILDILQNGQNVALVCDAGTPGLSDPGADIVRAAIEADIEVVAIPGASALLTALTSSGLENGPFVFWGFLSRNKAHRRKQLKSMENESKVMVFYEAPHRLIDVLEDMANVFGPDRYASTCREMTKMYEEKLRGSLAKLMEHFKQIAPRGEFTIIVSGKSDTDCKETELPTEEDLIKELDALMDSGMTRRSAAKQLAAHYDMKAGDIYALGLQS